MQVERSLIRNFDSCSALQLSDKKVHIFTLLPQTNRYIRNVEGGKHGVFETLIIQ